ncbi:UNVERIFIED_CONTAM: hypothetical protein PYX00_011823 [Menopon gallinae]|uniref:WDR36/Utp21 N-terminal domain-containing protein n=1 Tax=Menopon gallinae TaxID=328185 RepID=A0AAW2H8T4_9NEOP
MLCVHKCLRTGHRRAVHWAVATCRLLHIMLAATTAHARGLSGKNASTHMIKSAESGLFTYTRTLLERPDNFVVYEMEDVFYMAAVSSAVRVYNAKTFNLIFEGPSFRGRTEQILYHQKRLYVVCGCMIYVIRRGEVECAYRIAYDGVYTVSLVQSGEWGKAECAGPTIRCMLFVGTFVVVSMSTNAVLVMEHFNISYVIEDGAADAGEVLCVMHPSTYINKILIVHERKMQIYNIVSRKVIYTFGVQGAKQAVQTPLIDVVALVRDSDIMFLNLRLDKEMFRIEIPGVRCVSFRTDAAPYMICCNENAYVFEMSRLKCVAELKETYWACFLPGQSDLISAGQNLEFYSMEGYRPVLVHRRVLFSKVECMDIVSSKHIVLMQERRVIGMNIYKDDLTFCFSCKDLRNVSKVRADKAAIVVSGDSSMFLLDFDKKNGKLVNTSSSFEFGLLGFEHPFCVYGRHELNVFNVVSRRVVSKISVLRDTHNVLAAGDGMCEDEACLQVSSMDIQDIAVVNHRIQVALHDKVLSLSFEGDVLGVLHVAGAQKIRRYGNMLFMKAGAKVVVAEVHSLRVVREFEHDVLDYFVTKDQRAVGLLAAELLLVDIASGQVLERVCFEKTPRSAALSWNQDFLFVLFDDGTVCAYYNGAVLSEYLAQPVSLPTQDIELRKSTEQSYLIDIFGRDFFKAQRVLGMVDMAKQDYEQVRDFIDFYGKSQVSTCFRQTSFCLEHHEQGHIKSTTPSPNELLGEMLVEQAACRSDACYLGRLLTRPPGLCFD